MTLQKVMASAFSIRNLTKIKMEILFVFLGAVAILFELGAYAKIEKVNELRYKKSVGMVLDSQELAYIDSLIAKILIEYNLTSFQINPLNLCAAVLHRVRCIYNDSTKVHNQRL